METQTNAPTQSRSKWRRRFVVLAVLAIGLPVAFINACGGFVADKDFAAFKSALGNTSFTVYPAAVRQGKDFSYDDAAAKSIAGMIESEKLGEARVVNDHVAITHGWHMNQAKMLQETAQDLGSHVRSHPIDTEYVILVEYLRGPNEFGGVQCNIVDKHGTPAFALVLNSHNKRFANKSPKTPADCTEVLLSEMKRHFDGYR